MPAGKVWENGRWRDAEVAPIRTPEPHAPVGPCEDCTEGTPHMAGSVDDVPLWAPGERKAYGRFAEAIEMEDELRHAFD